MRSQFNQTLAIVGAVAAALILAIPISGNAMPELSHSSETAFIGTAVPTTLSLIGYAGTHLASPFYAVDFNIGGLPTSSLVALGAYFNSTPITNFRIGGGGEQYDPTTDTYYSPPPAGGQYTAHHTIGLNLTWLQSWCNSRTPHCDWLGYLPAEENDSKAALHVATWYHNVLGFVPTYWQFDNEPDHWTHYGKNRTNWSSTDHFAPSAIGYAVMVKNYIAMISAHFPNDRFVGIEASCDCDTALITTTAQVNMGHLAAMAYHSYPGPKTTSSALGAFYAPLQTNMNLSNTQSHFRANINASCPSKCANILVQVGEYQSGPLFVHSPYSYQYPGAVFFGASVIQGLLTNVSMFTEFDDSWLYNASTGQPLPEGMLYQRILANMTMGSDYALQVHAPGVGGVYSILIKNGTRESLLVVNTNTTKALKLSLGTALFPVGLLGSYYTWVPYAKAPVAHSGLSLPSGYLVQPQGILLLNNF